METGKYISDLLYHYDCIIISGLGGFVAEYHPAKANPATNLIAPPSKTFFFDEERKNDNNTLISYISSMELKPEDEVRQAIEIMAEDIKTGLRANEHVQLGDLGYFYRTSSGKTSFEFTGTKNFYAEALGLLEVEMPVHHEPKVVQHPKEHVSAPAQEKIKVPVAVIPAHTQPRRRGLLIAGIVLLLLAGGAGAIYYTIGFPEVWNKVRQFTAGRKIEIKPVDTSAVSDTGMGKTLDEQTRLKNALQVAREDSIKAKLKAADLTHYYLIAASFKDYEKALLLQKELIDKGFQSEIVNTDLRWYRVTMGTYTDHSQALLELEKVRAATRNDAIWLLPI